MKAHSLLFMMSLLTAPLLLSGCNSNDIPLVGLDANGNAVEVMLSKPEYSQRLGTALTAVHESSMHVLQKKPLGSNWMLRTVLVGIGLNAEIGLGPWKVGAIPKFRVVYSNSSDPALP